VESNDYIASLLPSYLERLALTVEEVKIPLRSDLSEYAIEDLEIDQKESLADVLYAVQQYCLGIKINDDNVLRITVTGVAGSGKSTWINTLVTIIRKMFPQDDIVSVFAPTGCAAFNARGEIHSTKASNFRRFQKILVFLQIQLDFYFHVLPKH
jgi:GTPase SAR1 family protein